MAANEQAIQAFNTVTNALDLANKNGAFGLQDAKVVYDSLAFLAQTFNLTQPAQPAAEEGTEATTETTQG